MWVRSLLSQADAKTRSTGAPHSVGTQGSVSRLRPFRSRDRRNVGYDKVCVHLRKTRVSQSVTSRTHPRSPHSVSKHGSAQPVNTSTGILTSILNTDV